MRDATTHWGQAGDLHPGTLDACGHPDCNTRRHLVDSRRNRRPQAGDSPGERGELEPVG